MTWFQQHKKQSIHPKQTNSTVAVLLVRFMLFRIELPPLKTSRFRQETVNPRGRGPIAGRPGGLVSFDGIPARMARFFRCILIAGYYQPLDSGDHPRSQRLINTYLLQSDFRGKKAQLWFLLPCKTCESPDRRSESQAKNGKVKSPRSDGINQPETDCFGTINIINYYC